MPRSPPVFSPAERLNQNNNPHTSFLLQKFDLRVFSRIFPNTTFLFSFLSHYESESVIVLKLTPLQFQSRAFVQRLNENDRLDPFSIKRLIQRDFQYKARVFIHEAFAILSFSYETVLKFTTLDQVSPSILSFIVLRRCAARYYQLIQNRIKEFSISSFLLGLSCLLLFFAFETY